MSLGGRTRILARQKTATTHVAYTGVTGTCRSSWGVSLPSFHTGSHTCEEHQALSPERHISHSAASAETLERL